MKKIFFLTLVITSFIILCLYSGNYALDEVAEELRLYLGEVKIISVSNPTRIAIGNPNVADVTNVTRSEITISPKAQGTTTLVVWDNFGEQSYKIKVFAEDIQEIKRRIDNLLAKLNLPEVYARAEEEEGKVLLLGRVKSPQDRERITVALGTLSEKIVDLIVVKEEEAVVEIDVQVLELSKDAEKTLGFTWPGSVSIATETTPSTTYAGTIPTKWSTFFNITNWSRTNFNWTLDALIQEGKARVLSRPRLACQSGKEAELLVGGEKPTFATYVTQTGGAGATIEYKEYGIKLKIKPTVTDKERIKIALNVEVSEVEAPESMGTWARAYPLKKRTTSTELFINDGQTLAIGGLIKQKTEEDIRKTPGLGDVPILGLFFRKKTTKIGGGQGGVGKGERGDTELFITLTPKIISEKKEVKEAKQEIKLEITPPIPGSLPTPVAGYTRIIQKRILDNLSYPALAREAGFQGAVKLRLHLSYQGELLDVIAKDSSGYKMLDDNAIRVAKEVSPYPPFPSSIDLKELWIEIPVVYRLD